MKRIIIKITKYQCVPIAHLSQRIYTLAVPKAVNWMNTAICNAASNNSLQKFLKAAILVLNNRNPIPNKMQSTLDEYGSLFTLAACSIYQLDSNLHTYAAISHSGYMLYTTGSYVARDRTYYKPACLFINFFFYYKSQI